ncbi:hypothetical protein HPB50_014579 [Hyalomma asiaticum]|uniref:Uncharacterized protein n=1 Tax=Hyalomma asiaticum TaxID=266040 RepID=A0ACB7RZG9_HYAAI|nr:hypothetical protein HPB50_014579 [Hyalomma asiaticum]
MGKDFTMKKALNVAYEEERVDRAIQQFSDLQFDIVSSRRAQDGVPAHRSLMAMAKVAALLPRLLGNMAPALFRLGVSLPPPVLTSSPAGACCLLACEFVSSSGYVLSLRLVDALGQLWHLPGSEPHLCAVREARTVRQSPGRWGIH